MAERTCCGADVLVFGHTSCELGQPVRPAWVIQPSSAPPQVQRAPDDFDGEVTDEHYPCFCHTPPAPMPPRPRRRRLLERITR